MIHDVYVFGDSHWRVFFPFVNHAVTTGIHNAITHTHTSDDGVAVRTIDTTGNGLSGSTIWGLLNSSSRHHARNTIINTLDSVGGVDNVGLVFGEVDARYHSDRYVIPGTDKISGGRILELVSRYVKFVQEDLLATGRVRQSVFIYHGFSYPKRENTLLQPSQPIGAKFLQAEDVNHYVKEALHTAFMCSPQVTMILPSHKIYEMVSDDGVHLDPKTVYEKYTFPAMASRFYDGNTKSRELPL